MSAKAWVPSGINVDVPSAARVYDYLLGGGHNFAVDRAVGEKVRTILTNGGQIAASNRAFMRRAVLAMIEMGVTQFLDLGSGIPTVGNVHEVALAADPACRVVYVDYDAVAVAHSRLILEGLPNTGVVSADMRDIGEVLTDESVRRLIDFSRPVGLLMVAVLHFVSDEADPAGIVGRYVEALPSGSLIALSHLTADFNAEGMAQVEAAMRDSRDPMYFRPRSAIQPLFDGLELLEPGLVSAPLWRPTSERETGPSDVYVGLARKP